MSVVSEIDLKAKRIGLWAMRAGLKVKIGCHRRPQRRPSTFAVGKSAKKLAEAVGFEPTEPCGSTVFKTAAFNHSATPPHAN